MKKINSIKVWEGPSLLDPSVIIMMVVTGLVTASSNHKTGDMLQTWIMRKDMPPHEAVKTGHDYAVCGDCLLRPSNREARLVSVHTVTPVLCQKKHGHGHGQLMEVNNEVSS